MYTRNSPSRDIADEIMRLGSVTGDISLDGNCKYEILDFLNQYGSTSTLQGWMDAVREHGHHYSEFTMAFILCYKYIGALFPQDVLDEFYELSWGLRQNDIAGWYLRYVKDGQMPEEYENSIPEIDGGVALAMDADLSWSALPGLQY